MRVRNWLVGMKPLLVDNGYMMVHDGIGKCMFFVESKCSLIKPKLYDKAMKRNGITAFQMISANKLNELFRLGE